MIPDAEWHQSACCSHMCSLICGDVLLTFHRKCLYKEIGQERRDQICEVHSAVEHMCTTKRFLWTTMRTGVCFISVCLISSMFVFVVVVSLFIEQEPHATLCRFTTKSCAQARKVLTSPPVIISDWMWTHLCLTWRGSDMFCLEQTLSSDSAKAAFVFTSVRVILAYLLMTQKQIKFMLVFMLQTKSKAVYSCCSEMTLGGRRPLSFAFTNNYTLCKDSVGTCNGLWRLRLKIKCCSNSFSSASSIKHCSSSTGCYCGGAGGRRAGRRRSEETGDSL